jgi:glycosyltransferase involved in cell wall biosynthesis
MTGAMNGDRSLPQPSRVPVSVVIPFYNDSETIRRAAFSAFDQECPPEEVIIVNDGSASARSGPILQELTESFNGRCSVITLTENGGPAKARNAGWDAARHDYVAFLDADDAWHRSKLRIQMGIMQRDTAITLSAHHRGVQESLSEPQSKVPEQPLSFESMLFRNKVPTASVVIRRDLPHRFDENLRYCEDYDLWLRILAEGNTGVFVPLSLATAFKRTFGDSGLSSKLFAMESAQTNVYRNLRLSGSISSSKYAVLIAWSRLRFGRRLAISLLDTVRHPTKR